jgi:hypothetical protein
MHTIDLSRVPQQPQLGPSLAIWLKRTVTGDGQDPGEWCLDRIILNTPNFSQDMRAPSEGFFVKPR